MSKPIIDIIVPHYNEPWSVGRNFFLMLSMQRDIDFKKVRVLIVQDGEDGDLEWEDIFTSCPYQVDVLSVEHGGIPAARNAGIKKAEADWVMFCDFDDTFSDVYSMRMILNVLPTNAADILWMNAYQEERVSQRGIFINNLAEDFTNTFGKLYRREWINENNIWFNTDLKFEYETVFNQLALGCSAPNRILRITTSFTMYAKTFRPNSYNYRRECVSEKLEAVFRAGVYLTEEFERRNMHHKTKICVAETFFEMYYLLNSSPRIKNYARIQKDFLKYFDKYKNVYDSVGNVELEICYDNISSRVMNIVQRLYNYYKIESEIPDNGINKVNNWLKTLKISVPDVITDDNPVILPAPSHPGKQERAVVYCGTYNTYANILASMKSLIATTDIDRIYLLIEDDQFPYDIPDCVTVMNVKDQTFFPETGPNFRNAWSYMCLMRAAFAKLLPDVDKILSLDIDIIVNEDIGCLWDIDISDYYLAGVPEVGRQTKASDPLYINFGVVMMNLAKLRNDGVDNDVIRLLNSDNLGCPEQDAFNQVCNGYIYPLKPDYNYTPFTHLTGEPEKESVVHYAGIKYWKHFSLVKKYADMSWDDVMALKKNRSQKNVTTQ